jgi:hypothetical protein
MDHRSELKEGILGDAMGVEVLRYGGTAVSTVRKLSFYVCFGHISMSLDTIDHICIHQGIETDSNFRRAGVLCEA